MARFAAGGVSSSPTCTDRRKTRKLVIPPEIEGLLGDLQLRPPAKPAALDAVERELTFPLPGQYKAFLMHSNGAEGSIATNTLDLWHLEDLIEWNQKYQLKEKAPGLFAFGGNGGAEAYAFDTITLGLPIVMVPFIGTSRKAAIFVAPGFNSFLKMLAKSDFVERVYGG